MGIRIREVDKINILDVDGKIDINSSEIIETVGWLTSTGKINIILNLENVDLVDYSGLSILAIAYKNAVNHKGRMKFLHVSLPIIELLKVVKLEGVFETYQDEESAIKSFDEDDVGRLRLRRKFMRLDIHLNVKYNLVGSQKNPAVFEGNVLNLSAAGVYIYTHSTLPINSQVELKFHIPNMPVILEASGRVAYIADKDIQPHVYPGMGVSFTHLTSEKEKAILNFIDKNVTHRAEPL